MSTPYYNKKKPHNFARLRNWTIYENGADQPDKNDYDIYYIDSEWAVAGAGDPDASDQVVFTGLQNAFNDGSKWKISAESANSTGTFACIIVRKSDRVAKRCVGVASDEQLANNALWTVTDVTGQVWHDRLRILRLLGYI